MGVRGRLIAVTTLVLGTTVLISLWLSLRLEDWEERRAAAERGEQITAAIAMAVSADLSDGNPDRLRRLLAPLERERAAFGLRSLFVLDRDGLDLAHDVSPRLDRFLEAVLVANDAPLVDPLPPELPRRVAHPIFIGGKRYVVVGVLDDIGVDSRLIERNRRLGAINVMISLLGLLLLLLLLSTEVLRPLQSLVRLAATLGRSEVGKRPEIAGGRELQQLNEALHDASVRLAQQRGSLEEEVARRTADLAAANAELSTMNVRLRQLALTDPLTSLFNRRALEQALTHEVNRQKRGARRPFSLMMIDVDNFKHLNDTHGHPAGDEVLRGIARVVPATLRASDVVARVGGEEFVVLLLDTELPHALTAAEKVRESVKAHPFVGGATQPSGHVTISIGLASWPKHGETAEAVLAAADRALYAAKGAGRDRVMSSTEATVSTPEPQQPV